MPVPEDLDVKDVAPPSNHIKAADFPMGWRGELTISDVNMQKFKRENEQEKTKFILSFKGKEKTLVLNETNKTFLEAALGSKPARWVGATIQLSVIKVKFQGQMVPGFMVVGAKAASGAQQPEKSGDVPF